MKKKDDFNNTENWDGRIYRFECFKKSPITWGFPRNFDIQASVSHSSFWWKEMNLEAIDRRYLDLTSEAAIRLSMAFEQLMDLARACSHLFFKVLTLHLSDICKRSTEQNSENQKIISNQIVKIHWILLIANWEWIFWPLCRHLSI